MTFHLFHENIVSATPWPAQKNRRKKLKRLKCLNVSIPPKFLHSFLPNTVSKKYKKSFGNTTIQHSLKMFTKCRVICSRNCPKSWEMDHNRRKYLQLTIFHIVCTPPCWPISQSKIKTIGYTCMWLLLFHLTII